MWYVVDRFCFFKQKTADEMRISDWSSDVCSSDLLEPFAAGAFDAGRDQCGVHVAVAELAAVFARSGLIQQDVDALQVGIGGAELLLDARPRRGFRRFADLDQAGAFDQRAADLASPRFGILADHGVGVDAAGTAALSADRTEEHPSELQSQMRT